MCAVGGAQGGAHYLEHFLIVVHEVRRYGVCISSAHGKEKSSCDERGSLFNLQYLLPRIYRHGGIVSSFSSIFMYVSCNLLAM